MTSSQTQGEANKALVQRFVEEVWNQANVALIDELVAPDFVEHPLWPNPVPLGPDDASAREQIRHDLAAFRGGMPDLALTIDQLLDSADKVTAIITHRGTPAQSGSAVTWSEICIYRIADGKIVEQWGLWDRLGFWQQVGIVPPTRELMARFDQASSV